MTEQVGDIRLNNDVETLYTNKSRSNNKSSTKSGYKNADKRTKPSRKCATMLDSLEKR